MQAMRAELRQAVQSRLDRARELLRQRGWHALWLGQSTNLRYLSGVVEKPSERLFGAYIPADGQPVMIGPRRAANIADAVMAAISRQSPVGRRERDVAADIVRLFEEHGSEGVSFSPISSAGPNAAFPHHMPDDTLIQPGQCLVLDFGGVH